MKFSSLGLSKPILKAVAEEGYDIPTAIQAEAIPVILNNKDIMAAAQTGTGKTAAFTLPILEKLSQKTDFQVNHPRVLVLTPTRELAAQVGESVETYGKYLSLRCMTVFGGVSIKPQISKLRRGIDILVATPGRLLDLYGQNIAKFDELEVLILDEADRMLDMGFIHDIKKIITALPNKRQNLMFSATFSPDIRKLAKGLVNNPVEISVTPRNTTVDTIKQLVYAVDKKQKPALLVKLIQEQGWDQMLVFVKTKHGANRLVRQLEKAKIQADAIHGNKSQNARQKALANFKKGSTQVLVATDIASRGIDINQLPQVVNFDLPTISEDYIHRIGRTGRAGANGLAISLVAADEFKQLFSIERLIKQKIERKEIKGFEPVHHMPESTIDHSNKKSKSSKIDHRAGKRSTSSGRGDKSKTTEKGSHFKNSGTTKKKPTRYGKKISSKSRR